MIVLKECGIKRRILVIDETDLIYSWLKIELGSDFKIEYTECPANGRLNALQTEYYAFIVHHNKWDVLHSQFTEYTTPIFFLDDINNSYNLQKAKSARISGYFTKVEPLSLLIKAILFPDLRKFWITEKSKFNIETLPNTGLYDQLTRREKEVFKYLVEGFGYKEVGFKMGITGKTVLAHRDKVMKKMGFKTLTDLIKEAIRLKIINL